jgi:hypothetical protein
MPEGEAYTPCRVPRQCRRPAAGGRAFESYKHSAAMKTTALQALYQEVVPCISLDLNTLLPRGIQHEVGHFNVFNLADFWPTSQRRPAAAYPSRSFYKISFLRSRSSAEYAHQTIDLAPDALVFSTPREGFQWWLAERQQGQFCLNSAEFMLPVLGGLTLDELPLFQASDLPVFQLTPAEAARPFSRLCTRSRPPTTSTSTTCCGPTCSSCCTWARSGSLPPRCTPPTRGRPAHLALRRTARAAVSAYLFPAAGPAAHGQGLCRPASCARQPPQQGA